MRVSPKKWIFKSCHKKKFTANFRISWAVLFNNHLTHKHLFPWITGAREALNLLAFDLRRRCTEAWTRRTLGDASPHFPLSLFYHSGVLQLMHEAWETILQKSNCCVCAKLFQITEFSKKRNFSCLCPHTHHVKMRCSLRSCYVKLTNHLINTEHWEGMNRQSSRLWNLYSKRAWVTTPAIRHWRMVTSSLASFKNCTVCDQPSGVSCYVYPNTSSSV